MKVLWLTNIPAPYRVEFFNELGKKIDLTVLFQDKNSDERDEKWISNRFKNFEGKILENIVLGKWLKFSIETIRILKNNNYDLLVIGGYSTITEILTIIYLTIIKHPFVLSVDGGIIKNDNKILLFVKRFLIKQAKWYLSSGSETNKYLIHYGANELNIHVYPFTSIWKEEILEKPISSIEKEELKGKLNINEEYVVLAVGRIIEIKGFDVLISASKLFNQNVGVYIIGGEPTDQFKRIINKLNIKNVYFKGFLSKSALEEYYKVSDIFVLPTRGDIWGLVINEAMSMGLPVITTNSCIAGLELIEDYKNGFIVQTDNVDMLADKINFTLSNDNVRNEMRVKNLDKIKEYSIERMVEVHYKIFDQILGNK